MQLLSPLVVPLLLGIPWMDPQWLLDHFHTEFVWLSLVIVFVECGLLFPFLPGDTLLFAIGLFVATDQLHLNIFVALVIFSVAAFLGNVVGYEIGRRVGPPLYNRDGRILKRKYLDQTRDFFDRHGNKALVIGRFVPFVRTYITLVAGITEMGRRRFSVWSAVGAVAWVLAITLLGYFLGQAMPWLAGKIDLVILGLLVLSVVPIAIEWWRHRRRDRSSTTADDRA
ncbi:MAG TPA: VTT domain-containing protein [Marmoricola sp.]|nr:VTT domain-containing protein [Marmoricola sp.]